MRSPTGGSAVDGVAGPGDAARAGYPLPGLLGFVIALGTIAVISMRSNFSAEAIADKGSSLLRHYVDLEVYQRAGAAVAAGGNLYDGPFVGDLPFTYPPFAGLVFQALAEAPFDALSVLWQVASFGALIAVIFAVLRERGYRLDARAGIVVVLAGLAALTLEPVRSTFYFGQINLFLMLLVSLDFLRGRRPFLGGVGTGVAAGLKLTPAFFGVIFLAQRRWRAAIVSVATFLITVVLGLVLIPDGSRFWSDAMSDSTRVGNHDNPGAQSLRSTIERAWGIEGGPWWVAAVLVTTALVIVAVVGAVRWGNLSLALAVAGIGMTLVSPFTWHHHWVYVVPLAICVWDGILRGSRSIADRRTAARWGSTPRWLWDQATAVLAVAASVLVLLPFTSGVVNLDLSLQSSASRETTWGEGWYVWPGVAVIAVIALAAIGDGVRRARGRRSVSDADRVSGGVERDADAAL